MLFLAPFGRERGKTAFQDDAGLEHLPGLKSVQRAHQAERGFAEIRRSVGNECAHTVPDLHHPHGGQIADTGAQTGATDLEGARKLAFRRNLISGLQGSILDQ